MLGTYQPNSVLIVLPTEHSAILLGAQAQAFNMF